MGYESEPHSLLCFIAELLLFPHKIEILWKYKLATFVETEKLKNGITWSIWTCSYSATFACSLVQSHSGTA